MNISGIIYDSVVDGEGIRNTLFISGCLHHCHGCHNPQTWDFNYGYEFTKEKQKEFIKKCKDNPLLDGITISGGDPIYSSKELIPFLKEYKKENPTHTVWLYTGFKYEDIKDNEILKLIDILVDGEYVEDLRDITLAFRGSSNQRIIKLEKGIAYDSI